MKTGLELITIERVRQITVEGWSAKHDAVHHGGELANAAACYAATVPVFAEHRACCGGDIRLPVVQFSTLWPFECHWYKPTPEDRVRELVKAGALIAAEIDRLQEEKALHATNKTPIAP